MEQNTYHYQIAARDIDGPIVFQYCSKADLTNDAEGGGSSLNSETGSDSLYNAGYLNLNRLRMRKNMSYMICNQSIRCDIVAPAEREL